MWQRAVQWWQRPCGGREVLAIALPMIVSYGMWAVMHLIDRLYLLNYSQADLAASLAPGMMQWALVCLPMGIAAYVNTFVAQYQGSGHPERIGRITWQGIWIALTTLPLAWLARPIGLWVFTTAGHSADAISRETEYLAALGFGAPAIVLHAALSAYFTGRGKMVLVMAANLLASSVNIVFDYLMIFGEGGFPEWGIYGAGLATSLANWSSVLVLCAALLRPSETGPTHFWPGMRFDFHLLKRLLRYGLPSGLPMLVESAGLFTLVLLVSRFGTTAAAATNLAFNINSVAFVPMMGIGIAVSTLVGQNLAAGKPHLAERATWTALALGIVYQAFFAALYVFTPGLLLLAHAHAAHGDAGSDFAETRQLTMVLLRFVAVYCVFDAAQIIFVGALKGAGDTMFIMLTVASVSTLGILAGLAGERWLEFKVLGWWWVLTGWITALGIIYLARFVQGRWKTMRVIESEKVLANHVDD